MEIQLWLLIVITSFAKNKRKIEAIIAFEVVVNTTWFKLSIITQPTQSF
jgi:hemerythrin superfamily protein